MELNIYEIFSMGRSLLCSRQVALTNIIYGMPVQEDDREYFSVYMDGLGVMHWSPKGMEKIQNWRGDSLYARMERTETGSIKWACDAHREQDESSHRRVTVPESAGIIYHELLHHMWKHVAKMQDLTAKPYHWNLAADMVVNQTIEDVGLPLIPGYVSIHSLPYDLQKHIRCTPYPSVEFLYDLIKDLVFEEKRRGNNCSGIDHEHEVAAPATAQIPTPQPEEQAPTPTYPTPQLEPEGGTSEGVPVPLEPMAPEIPGEGNGSGEKDANPPEATESTPVASRIEKKHLILLESGRPLEEQIEDLLEVLVAGGIGNVPGSLAALVKGYVSRKTKVPWNQILREGLRRAVTTQRGKGRSKYDKPHRRKGELSKEFLFPRTLDPKATLMIVIDTSGSVPTESLHKVFAEMQEVSKLTGGFWVVECDMIVQSKIGVSPGDPVPEIGKGRGGTSFAPPFKLAAEMSPAPDVLVYFTDGEGYAPKDPPPNLEVFWVIDNTEYTEPRFLGSRFGEIIYVTRDRQTKTSW